MEISFTVPGGAPAGLAQLRVVMQGKSSDPVDINYQAVPTTPPVVLNVAPSAGKNLVRSLVTVKMQNMFQVADVSLMRVRFELPTQQAEVTSATTNSQMEVLSSMAQTDLTFNTPVMSAFGTATVRVWQVGREDLNATFPFFLQDASQAAVAFALPASGKASVTTTVEVQINRFGKNLDESTLSLSQVNVKTDDVSAGTNVKSLTIAADGTTALLVIDFQRFSPTANTMTVEVRSCPLSSSCPQRTVTFPFEFRDPNLPFVTNYNPPNAFTDGKVPVSVFVENLDTTATAADMFLLFGNVNATSVTIVWSVADPSAVSKADATVEAVLPTVASPRSVTPTLNVPKVSLALAFPTPFTFKTAPNPVILGVNPFSADVSQQTAVSLSLLSFPGVTANSDVIVELRWPDNTAVKAQVTAFTRTDGTAYPTAIQDIDIQILSPIGAGVVESSAVRVVVYHTEFQTRQTFFDGFRMVDPTLPVVSGMMTEEGQTGADAVKVRASVKTQTTALISNARKAIASVFVSDIAQDIALTQYDAASRAAKAVWTTPKSQTATSFPTVYGQVRYEGSCGAQCTTDCCATGQCSAACACSLSCFKLVFYDDLKPVVLFTTELSGPEIGGTEVIMEIAKLPQIATGAEAEIVFDGTAYGEVYVIESSSQSTKLQIFTPVVAMNSLPTRAVTVSLVVKARPDRPLTFAFTYTAVVTSVASFSPSAGLNTGGQAVTVNMRFYPFNADTGAPDTIGIDFAGATLASAVTVSPVSDNQLTVFSFTTPAVDPGAKTVKVYPKSDPFGDRAVEFTFAVTDSTFISLVQPVPSAGPSSPPAGTLDIVSVENYPTYATTASIRFLGAGGIDVTVAATVTVAGGLATLSYARPSPGAVGASVATLTVTATDPNVAAATTPKTVSWAYDFYDGNAVRFMNAIPATLPTNTIVYGRSVALQPTVRVRIAQMPQHLAAADVTAVFGGIFEASVLSVQHTDTCSASGVDCNRTTVTLRAPDISSPVTWNVVITGAGQQLASFDMVFFSPCAFDDVCSAVQRTADQKWLSDNPPASAACFTDDVCVNQNNLLEPTITKVSPISAPATGGTVVTLEYQNIPAFSSNDVVITFGSGSTAVLASVSSLVATGTLVDNAGTIQFVAPKVPGGNTRVLTTTPVTISVDWGSISSAKVTSFTYTPVVEGASSPRSWGRTRGTRPCRCCSPTSRASPASPTCPRCAPRSTASRTLSRPRSSPRPSPRRRPSSPSTRRPPASSPARPSRSTTPPSAPPRRAPATSRSCPPPPPSSTPFSRRGGSWPRPRPSRRRLTTSTPPPPSPPSSSRCTSRRSRAPPRRSPRRSAGRRATCRAST